MISIRTFTRSAHRVASRLTNTSIRRTASLRPSLLQSSIQTSRIQCASAFSTTSMRAKSASPESDAELVEKIQSEIVMEDEMASDDMRIPTSVKDYLDNSPFEIIDTPGQEEVVLTRTFGNEKIQVSFSVADLNAQDPESDFPDNAQADEEDFHGAPQKTRAAQELEEEEEVGGEEGLPEAYPARINVIVEKANKGAVAIETVAVEGSIQIENVYYYANAAHAYSKTPGDAHQSADMYAGPPFSNLDEDLQVMMERYLDERGINQSLALFVPDYIDVKEQREYLRWLENLKGFISA